MASSSGSCGDIEVYLRLYSPSSDKMVWYRTTFNFSHKEDSQDSKKRRMTMRLHKFSEDEPKSSSGIPNKFSTCAGVSPYIYLFGSPRSTAVYRINTQNLDRKWEECPPLIIERFDPYPLVFGTSLIVFGSLPPYFKLASSHTLAIGEILEDASLEKLHQWDPIYFPPNESVQDICLCALHTAQNQLLYVPSRISNVFAYDLREERWSSLGNGYRILLSKPQAYVVKENFVWWIEGSICVSDFNLKRVSRKSCSELGLIGGEYASLTEVNSRSKVRFLHLADHLFLLIWKADLKVHFLELAIHPCTKSHGKINLDVSIHSENVVEGSEIANFLR